MSGIVIKPDKKEVRSKRINLIITPSLYKAARKKCKSIGISLNECVNQLLSNWVIDEENPHGEEKGGGEN